MLQPKFTRWPWGTLAVLAPVFASVAAVLHFINDPVAAAPGSSGDEQLWRASSVFFGVLGAANAYLIGIAIGDLGRSVVALPLGALTGFGATWLLREPIGAIGVTIVFGIIMLNAVSNGIKILAGCSVTIFLMIVLMTLVARESSGNSHAHILLAYPLVVAIVTASMPLERSVDGILSAFLVGARSSLYGMLVGVVAYCMGMSVYKILDALIGLPWSAQEYANLASLAFAAAASNVYCMKLLFDAVYRVAREGDLVELESVPPPPDQSEAAAPFASDKNDEVR